jgi:EF hand
MVVGIKTTAAGEKMIAGSRNAPKELSIAAAGQHQARRSAERRAQRRAYWLYFAFAVAALAASTVLVAVESGAQTAASVAPRYSAKDIARAFSFIDANKDGSISRAEAASFRNVAKHFDAADANKDGALSTEEFSNALERSDRPVQSSASAGPR